MIWYLSGNIPTTTNNMPRAKIDKSIKQWSGMQFDYLVLPSGLKMIGRTDRTRFTANYYYTREEALAAGVMVTNAEWGIGPGSIEKIPITNDPN